MILGLTGRFAAGKGTVAETLVRRGFVYHSLSDLLREELRADGIPESRDSLHAIGNRLRREGGPGALALRLLPRLQDGRDHIVDSIRNPVEVEVLRRLPGFTLVAVDADPKVRFARLRARARIGDPETFEEFAAHEAREAASEDPTTQQLAATYAEADVEIRNDGTPEDLERAVTALLDSLAAGGTAT